MTNPTGDALKERAVQVETVALLKEAKTFMASSVAMGAKFSKHNVNQAAWRVKAAIERLEEMSAALSSVEQAPQPVAGEAHVLGYISQNSLDLMHGKIKAHAKIYPKQDSTASIPVYINTPTEAPPVESQAAEEACQLAKDNGRLLRDRDYWRNRAERAERNRAALAAEGSAE